MPENVNQSNEIKPLMGFLSEILNINFVIWVHPALLYNICAKKEHILLFCNWIHGGPDCYFFLIEIMKFEGYFAYV